MKPANIIYFKDAEILCKLSDFDTLIQIGDEMTEIPCSFEYTAPEVYSLLAGSSSAKTKEELNADLAAAMSVGDMDEVIAIGTKVKALEEKPIASTAMDMWSLGVSILYVLIAPTGFGDLPKEEEARRVAVADGTFVQTLAQKLPQTNATLKKARRALYDGGETPDLLSLDPCRRMNMAELSRRGLMSDKSTATSLFGQATNVIAGAVDLKMKKHITGAVKDIAIHVDGAVEAGSDRTIEKIGEERTR